MKKKLLLLAALIGCSAQASNSSNQLRLVGAAALGVVAGYSLYRIGTWMFSAPQVPDQVIPVDLQEPMPTFEDMFEDNQNAFISIGLEFADVPNVENNSMSASSTVFSASRLFKDFMLELMNQDWQNAPVGSSDDLKAILREAGTDAVTLYFKSPFDEHIKARVVRADNDNTALQNLVVRLYKALHDKHDIVFIDYTKVR